MLLSLAHSPRARRVVQALAYEAIAIAVVGPVLALVFAHPVRSAFGLAAAMSAIALVWNYSFNTLFERWEARQTRPGRSLARRVVHGAGFEGGLTVILVPIMAAWLGLSLLQAFIANLGLLVFFLGYTVAFTWAFDQLFGLPESARGLPPPPTPVLEPNRANVQVDKQ